MRSRRATDQLWIILCASRSYSHGERHCDTDAWSVDGPVGDDELDAQTMCVLPEVRADRSSRVLK
jgi:hypothetical protein